MITASYAGQTLHNPLLDNERVVSGKLSLEASAAGTFLFSLAPEHPLCGQIELMRPDREVIVTEEDHELFRGRVISEDAADDGICTYFCEGQLAYLNDTLVRPYGTYAASSEHGSREWDVIAPRQARAYIEWLVEQHNVHEPAKSFSLFVNQLPDDLLTRSSTVWPKTSSEIKEKLLDHFGAYIVAGSIESKRTLSIITTPPECSQHLEFGTNLTDYARGLRFDDAVSAVIPYAKDNSDEFGITSLPDGPISNDCTKIGDRIICISSAEQMGYIEQRRSFDGASSPEHLSRLASEWLEGSRGAIDSLTIKGIDLSRVKSGIQPISLLDSVRVISRPHGVDQRLVCVQIEIDLTSPSQSIYTFGAMRPSLVRTSALRTHTAQTIADEAVQAVDPISREAKAAAATAKTKRRVFTSKPTPPYDKGDLWVQGSTGGIFVCETSRKE
ncbi:hypothetical protein [Cryptobacterium curtum]